MTSPSSSGSSLNVVLQEDLIIRGGAQLWLWQCGVRLRERGHAVTYLVPSTSLLLEDLHAVQGAQVETYDADKIADNPQAYQEQFTRLLTPAHVCVSLVRQNRGQFQNVSFVAQCIVDANLKTHLIAKTGTPDPTYQPSFYGGPLLDIPNRVSVITIAQYTRDFLISEMKLPPAIITNIYNGTDTTRFQRTPDMVTEAAKRYPCPPNSFVVGCIGSFEERKAQAVLLQAAKLLVDSKRLPNIYCLLVGEGPDKEMLQCMIEDLKLEQNAKLYDFTKEPFFVFERCHVVALPSTGKEGLPNVLLEALAMETPCVATRAYGMPEVVLDGRTGFCFPSGNVEELAHCLERIAKLSDEQRQQMAQAGKELVFSEHDKSQQFEKLLALIQTKAQEAFFG